MAWWWRDKPIGPIGFTNLIFLSSWQKIICTKSTHLISRLKKERIKSSKQTTKKKRNNEKERTKKHVCVLNALASSIPDPTSDASTTHSRQSYVSSSRADNTGRDGGIGRVGTPPGVFEQKTWGQTKKRGGKSSDLGIKLFFKLGIMEKQKKRIIGIGSWKLFVKEGRVMETMPGKESFGEYENQQVGVWRSEVQNIPTK